MYKYRGFSLGISLSNARCKERGVYTEMRILKSNRESYMVSWNQFLDFRLPIFQPQRRRDLTILGVTAAVSGTLKKMKLLCMAYASASCVHIPIQAD